MTVRYACSNWQHCVLLDRCASNEHIRIILVHLSVNTKEEWNTRGDDGSELGDRRSMQERMVGL